MDIISFYDEKGVVLKTITFSDNSIPEFDSKNKIFNFKNGYTGYSYIYPTKDFIYLKRNKVKIDLENNQPRESVDSHILKIDWNGNVISNYFFSNKNFVRFCVSSDDKKLYLIVNEQANDLKKDYFSIYSYEI